MPSSLFRHRPALVLGGLTLLALISIACFMLLGAKGSWAFVLPFRGTKLLGLVLVAVSVAVSTVLFQTVTNNRILSPAIMGFDWLYVLIQTLAIFFVGWETMGTVDPRLTYMGEVVIMVGCSVALFRWLFVDGNRSLHLLVLVGIVFGILFRSSSNFLQRMLDPNQFQVLQDMLFASFNSVDPTLVWVSTGIVGLCLLVVWRLLPTFDVLSLGRAPAISLGLNYKANVMAILTVVAILVSVSTALVGPVTFFGLLVANLAYAAVGNSKHRYTLPAAILLAIITLVGGQTILERVFAFNTALSIIIEFLGGLVFILLVLRGGKR